VASNIRLHRRPTHGVKRRLALASLVCFAIVVLTHVAERWNIFPVMGWGQPDSPGHYLDLASAILGIALLVAALFAKNSP
jgi:hypothetical protein